MKTDCVDETNLTPFVPNTVPQSIVQSPGELDLNHHQNSSDNFLFRWLIDGTPQVVDWNQPTLKTVLENGIPNGGNLNVHEMPTKDGWYLWYIRTVTPIPLPHPIHLHGHDFYIVGKGPGAWDGTANGLTFDNPTRRDTATLPAGGYLLLAFPADNPGLWVCSSSASRISLVFT